MKKFVSLLCIFIACAAQSQNSLQLTLLSNSTIVAANAVFEFTMPAPPSPASFVAVSMDIKNTSQTFTNTYTVKQYILAWNFVAREDSSSPRYCVGGQCYPVDTKTAIVPFTLNPLESLAASSIPSTFDIDCDEASRQGYTLVKYTVCNLNDVNDTFQLTTVYNKHLIYAGLSNSSAESRDIALYPNPARDNVKLNLPLSNKTELNITDVNGKLVRSIYIDSNASEVTDLDVSPLAKGIYFLECRTSDAVIRKKLLIE